VTRSSFRDASDHRLAAGALVPRRDGSVGAWRRRCRCGRAFGGHVHRAPRRRPHPAAPRGPDRADLAAPGRAQRRRHGCPGGGECRRGLLPGLARRRRAGRRRTGPAALTRGEPRKPSAAASRIANAIESVVCTISGAGCWARSGPGARATRCNRGPARPSRTPARAAPARSLGSSGRTPGWRPD
jgi:hypothetical protein